MADPRFSVLMPTKDRRAWLPRAVASVCDQTLDDWELIVLDNGTDKVENVLPSDSRIVYSYQPDTRGIADALNRSIDLASGELLLCLADDDWIPPHALETYDREIGDADWIIAETVAWTQDGAELYRRGGTRESVEQTRGGNFMLGLAVCWRRALDERFDPHYEFALDVEFFVRVLAHREPAVCSDALHYYTDHPETMSRRYGGEQFGQMQAAYATRER